MTNTNLNWADSGSTDGEVCHKFSVNKVEQNLNSMSVHALSVGLGPALLISRILG